MMGRMQKGEYYSPVRIYGRIIVGAYRIRPILHTPNTFAPILHTPKIMHLPKYPWQNSRYTVKCFTPGYETFGGISS